MLSWLGKDYLIERRSISWSWEFVIRIGFIVFHMVC